MVFPDVIVVGGAVGGAALGNALGWYGVKTLVLEKVTREIHSARGDLLHPPTLKMLDKWGVLAAMHADGTIPLSELAVTDSRRGMVGRFPIQQSGTGPADRTIAIPHDRIEAVFYNKMADWPTVTVERGTATSLLTDENGRVSGVRYRPHDSGEQVEIGARVVVGADGARSVVRRSVGIDAPQHPYEHEQIIISGQGETNVHGLHWFIDEKGAISLIPRPRGAFRILLAMRLGERGDLLKKPDPALKDYLVGRFPELANLDIRKENAHVYRLAMSIADRFWAPGVALVGDSAQTTHPAGATGMSQAITEAAKLADLIAPVLLSKGSTAKVDEALERYDGERRPAARAAVSANHEQALRLWQSDLHKDPDAYARAVDPTSSWGAGGAGWGQDPAALVSSSR
jgi:2-polyprenyl-6-methoxyphenol hydroxylase-like FAD-dependent oxidoreductase